MLYRGSFVALVTPFDEKGRLDRKTLEKLVAWHISEGTEGIVCSASTGEGVSLSETERKAVVEICIRTAAGRVPIIASTGVSDTRTSIRYSEQAQKLGADACLVVTPYYNRPSQRGCILHFQEVAQVGLPVIVYHNPGRAVVRLTIETIAEIGQIPNVVAIKESSYDLELVRKIRVKTSLAVLAGDDDLTLEMIRAGAAGGIGVTPNLIPRGWKEMIHLALQGEWVQAERLAKKYLPLNKVLFSETNPQCVKFALAWLNRCKPVLRLPLTLPSEAVQGEIKKTILQLALPQFQRQAALLGAK